MKTKNQLALAPWVFTIGFFLLWEAICRGLNVSSFILPAPSTIMLAVWEYRNQLAYHALFTLWMTLAGFGLAVGFGLLLGHGARLVAPHQCRHLSAARWASTRSRRWPWCRSSCSGSASAGCRR